ncbi:MAG: CgeB family protein [Thermoleophilia bacterium]
MRIIHNDCSGGAGYYIVQGRKNAVEALGWKMLLWDGSQPEKTFEEFEPDLFITDVRFRHRIPSRIRRKQTVVVATVDQWASPWAYPENARQGYRTKWRDVRWIRKLDPELLFHHTSPAGIERGWRNWSLKESRRVLSLPLAGDTIRHRDEGFDEKFACDVGFVGGWWPNKAPGLRDYLLSYAGAYNTIIYGPGWPDGVSRADSIADGSLNRLYRSATVTPCVHEPHARIYGYEVTERLFKVPLAGGFTISDPVACIHGEGYFKEDEILVAQSPEDMADKVDYFIRHPEERAPFIEKARQRVLAEHTYFHRLAALLAELGFAGELQELKEKISARGYDTRGLD